MSPASVMPSRALLLQGGSLGGGPARGPHSLASCLRQILSLDSSILVGREPGARGTGWG